MKVVEKNRESRQIDSQTDRETERDIDIQAGRQTKKQPHTELKII